MIKEGGAAHRSAADLQIEATTSERLCRVIGLTTVQIVLVIYAVLLLVGGFIGYRKAGSRPSLIAGTISGLVALLAAGIMLRDARGIWLGIALALAMVVVFSIRFARTRKFMPSGMLGVVSLVVLGLLLGAILI